MIPIASLVRPSLGAADTLFGTARRLTRLMRPSDHRAAALVTQLAEALRAEDAGRNAADEETQAARALVQSTWRRLAQQPLDRLFVTIDDPWRTVRLDYWLERSFAEALSDDHQVQQRFADLVAASRIDLERANNTNRPPVGSAGGDSVPGESTGSVPVRGGQIAKAPATWPKGPPTVSEHAARGGNLYVVNVPLTVTADSPWEYVTVQVDRQEQNLWFHRADLETPVTMPLPRSRDGGPLQGKLLHAWASGPLLCLRVGTDLCGFWLPDADGQLPTAPLWPAQGETVSLAGKRPPYAVALTEANETPRPLWDDSIPHLADKFSRPVGMVGPVRPTYLCYQQRGNLVALDPLTGREIWCRSGLPVGTYGVGDDDRIVLLRDDSPSVLVLRSLDGATVAEWDWRDALRAPEQPGVPSSRAVSSRAVLSHIVAVRGTLAVWHSHPPQQPGEESRLQDDAIPGEATATIVDLTNGRVLWSQSVDPGSWVFSIDGSLLGNLAADGALTLRDWETGNTVAAHQVTVPNAITNLFVLTDAETAFVVASGRLDDRRLLGATQIRGGFRRPLVNGWMHAIERSTGRHVWEHELANVGLIRDQPRHVPLLVTSYMIQDPDRNATAGVLQCFDRRTGDLLYEQLRHQRVYIYHAVRSDIQRSRVEVETSKQIIRFQYGSAE